MDNDGTSVSNGSELSVNSTCLKPEDELEKPAHRSNSSLGVVSRNATAALLTPVLYCAIITDVTSAAIYRRRVISRVNQQICTSAKSVNYYTFMQ